MCSTGSRMAAKGGSLAASSGSDYLSAPRVFAGLCSRVPGSMACHTHKSFIVHPRHELHHGLRRQSMILTLLTVIVSAAHTYVSCTHSP